MVEGHHGWLFRTPKSGCVFFDSSFASHLWQFLSLPHDAPVVLPSFLTSHSHLPLGSQHRKLVNALKQEEEPSFRLIPTPQPLLSPGTCFFKSSLSWVYSSAFGQVVVRQLFLVVPDERRGLKQARSTSLEAEIRLRDFKAFE